MKRVRSVVVLWLMATALVAYANGDVKEQLRTLYERAEQCYLTDDFEQQQSCMKSYRDLYLSSVGELGDSADVFYAYLNKIRGAYYYGLAENEDYSFKMSKTYYRESLNTFAKRHSDRNVITLRNELAQLYYKVKRYDAALEQLDTIFSYYDEHLNVLGITSYEPDYYRTLSQLAICHARLGHFDEALQQIKKAQLYFKKQKSEFYYETLRRQGKILMLQADSLGTTHYKEARKCYERYVTEELSSIVHRLDTMTAAHRAQHWLATHKFLYDCYRLGGHAPEMLYDLTLYSKGFLFAYENDTHTPQVRWEQVRKELTASDCAIEFVQYFGRNDERRMGCLVLKNNTKPQFIDLFATDSLLSLNLTYPYTVGDALDASKSEIKDTLYRDKWLPQLIWPQRLMEAIGKARKVYFAPDGMIHQWAIEYLIPDSQKVCYRLSSTRNLTRRQPALKMQSALFCGGITYNAVYRPKGIDNDYLAYRYLKPVVAEIVNLPFAKMEVDSIFACRQNPNDTLIKGDGATDDKVMEILGRRHFDIVHFTTHGHYIGRVDVRNDLRPMADDLSLSRCGLLFAGAKNTFKAEYYDDSRYDALLSGAELAKRDFSNTELVVLNACQTGQGRLTDDGVFGLQRALKQAGANAMIVSLWNLADDSSAFFLRFFYEEIKKQESGKIDIHSAFLTARKRLMEYERWGRVWDEATLGSKLVVWNYRAPRHVNPFVIIDAF